MKKKTQYICILWHTYVYNSYYILLYSIYIIINIIYIIISSIYIIINIIILIYYYINYIVVDIYFTFLLIIILFNILLGHNKSFHIVFQYKVTENSLLLATHTKKDYRTRETD